MAELKSWIRRHRIQVIGASPDGAVDYDEEIYKGPILLLLGGERKGLSEEQRSICDRIVRIPMTSGIDSLNLAVAGSLLMYEVIRSMSRR
jgi:TrmH family RNA methyltransferase